jgi:hypothetical protein
VILREELSSWDLRFFGILRRVECQFLTDGSGQSIRPVFKGQDPFTLEDGPDGLSRNTSKELPFYAA